MFRRSSLGPRFIVEKYAIRSPENTSMNDEFRMSERSERCTATHDCDGLESIMDTTDLSD